MSTAAVAIGRPRGGFWIRTVAYVVDAVILTVLALFVGLVFGSVFGGTAEAVAGWVNAIALLGGIAYFVLFWSSAGGGRTLGMRIFSLKVVATDGSELSVAQTLVRYVGLIIAAIPLLIGLLWVAFDKEKQGWHDKIAGTYVIRT